jgi:hypothetical protein
MERPLEREKSRRKRRIEKRGEENKGRYRKAE